jgi:hypothetical protein
MNKWMTPQKELSSVPLSDTKPLSSALPWLTVEVSLWGLLLAISLVVRLLHLDAAPLNHDEAQGALAALRFARGEGAAAGIAYSPLLFAAQWLSFGLFSASALTARLLPALAGMALTLAPFLLRRQIGRIGALAAGLLLALSPTALTLSRTGSGDILVALGALACAAGLAHVLTGPAIRRVATSREGEDGQEPAPETALAQVTPAERDFVPARETFFQTGHQGAHNLPAPAHDTALIEMSRPDRVPAGTAYATRLTYLIPVGLALMLVSGPLAYSALLSLGLAMLLLALADAQGRSRLARTFERLRAASQVGLQLLATFLGTFVLLSTAFGWNLAGLGAAAALLPEWAGGFVHWADSLSPAYPALVLVLYEPLILFLGGAGVVLSTLRANNRTALMMGLWSIVALLLALFRPGHTAGDVLLVSLPLAVLAGVALQALWDSLQRWGEWRIEGLFLALSLPLWAYLALNLTMYTSRPAQYAALPLLVATVAVPSRLILALTALILQLILTVTFGYLLGRRAAVRGIGVSLCLALLVYTLSAGWGVSQNRPADPREPLLNQPTAPEIRLLEQTLTRYSLERTKDAYAAEVTVLADDPALAWSLRDFRQVHFVDLVEPPIAGDVVIAPLQPQVPPWGTDFAGQVFTLRRQWSAREPGCAWIGAQTNLGREYELDCHTLADWLLFRRGSTPGAVEQVVLWVRTGSPTGQ